MTNAQLCFLIANLWLCIPQRTGANIISLVFGVAFIIASLLFAIAGLA